MKKRIYRILLTSIFLIGFVTSCNSGKDRKVIEVDVCVYGGSSAGIIAAYTAKKQGKTVLVIEPGNYLGGLTTGGLGATDIGNKFAITGLAKDFYRRIGKYYDKFEQWTFEPHVAGQVFDDLINEADLDILKNTQLLEVKKDDGWIKEIIIGSTSSKTTQIVKAKMFIDCTYEGDLMAKSGVSYTVGRESNELYGETFNGVQLSDFHQLPDGIDPYVIPGDPSSGLLWGISTDTLLPQGSGDKKVQAYNFRLALTQDRNNQIPFTKPEGYDPEHYELLSRIIEKEEWSTIHSSYTLDTLANGEVKVNHSGGFLIKNMPNGKTDVNNFGGFSTDMIGANHDYPEASYAKRKEIWKAHENYTKGLLYFLSNDNRTPSHIREEMKSWGYSKDEFTDLDGFPSQLYIREARRMVSDVVMNQQHCDGELLVEDGIGMAAYQMDSHNIQRIIVDGMVKNEGDVQKRVFKPFPISYRSIIPNLEECKNLLVPVCLSASHIAFGSIRMEPVFMALAQSAATAASLAIDGNIAVQDVNITKLQEELKNNPLADRSSPEILIDNTDSLDVEISGVWGEVGGGYGINQLLDSNPAELKEIKYFPEIPKEGKYEIFLYLSRNPKRTSRTQVIVNNGDKDVEYLLQTTSIKELGLSSGEWVSVGIYPLKEGKKSYVKITNQKSDGLVTADAVIWKSVL